ncbi:MAG: hypothetical protein ACOCVM_07635, partial [Desulfovibrionaceae bacterium]
MKLRKKQTGLKVAREGRPPKKPILRVTTLLYVAGLAALLLYVAWFLGMEVFTIDGQGRVELERLYVGAGEEGVVNELLVAERAEVQQGQPVAKLILESEEEQLEQAPESPSLVQRDILKTENDVAKLRSELNLLRSRLARKSEQLETLKERERLERA